VIKVSEETHAGIKQETPGGNIKEIESDIDELILYLLKRLSWYMKKLENLQEDVHEANRTSCAVSQLVSSLHKLCAIKGVDFHGNVDQQHIFDLLQKLDSRTRKKVEEVIKRERKHNT
jgi:hypothetical protein